MKEVQLTEEKYLVLIDSNEFQKKVLDCINNQEEIDKLFHNTIFGDDPKCKQAMIHGMCIASMMTSQCEPTLVKITDQKYPDCKSFVESLISVFEDMAKRETLLTGKNISQEDLLNQIVGTIVKTAYNHDTV